MVAKLGLPHQRSSWDFLRIRHFPPSLPDLMGVGEAVMAKERHKPTYKSHGSYIMIINEMVNLQPLHCSFQNQVTQGGGGGGSDPMLAIGGEADRHLWPQWAKGTLQQAGSSDFECREKPNWAYFHHSSDSRQKTRKLYVPFPCWMEPASWGP